MILLRDRILAELKASFPEMATIIPFVGKFSEDAEGNLSYVSPALILATPGMIEAPQGFEPWEMQVEFSIAVAVKGASAEETDRAGWTLATEVGNKVYRNCWGFAQQIEVTPAVITGITKNARFKRDGAPTGQHYWLVDFHHFATFDTLLKGK